MALQLPDFLTNYRRPRPVTSADETDEQLDAPQTDAPQQETQPEAQPQSWQQVALSSFGSKPLPIFQGHPQVNQFASSDVQRLVGQQANDQQESAPQSTSTPPDATSSDERDKSIIAPPDRMDAVFQAGGLRSGIISQPSTISSSAATASTSPASSYIVRDKNGRPTGISPDTPAAAKLDAERALQQAITDYQPHKQSLLGSIARNALRGFAAGGPGGAIFGSIMGATPQGRMSKDQNWKDVALAGVKQQIQEQSAEQMRQAQLDHLNAETQALNAKNSSDGQTARTRSQALGEAARRLRMMGGTYTPGRDAQLDVIVNQYGLAPKQRGAGGFNPQNVKVIGNQMVYVENVDGKPTPVVIYSNDELTPQERTRNAIALEGVNAQRARNGQAPLMIAPEVDAPTSQPAMTNTTSSPSQPQSQPPQPQSPQTNTSPAPVQPSGGQRPVLVPVPGGSAPPASRRGGRGNNSRAARSSTGYQSRSQEIGASLESRDAARYTQEAANARAQAAAARSRGEDDVAASWEAAASTADENARKVGTRQSTGARTSTQTVPKKGDPLGILD